MLTNFLKSDSRNATVKKVIFERREGGDIMDFKKNFIDNIMISTTLRCLGSEEIAATCIFRAEGGKKPLWNVSPKEVLFYSQCDFIHVKTTKMPICLSPVF